MADPGAAPADVLVADDDPLVRTVLRMALAGLGHRVLEARSVSEVVHLDAETSIDLVILDINMPGGTTSDCLDALAARSPRPRVLLLSGENAPAFAARADGFARKPIDLSSFQEIVARLLAAPPLEPSHPDGR
jgi:two-component system, OmpR family, response regulator